MTDLRTLAEAATALPWFGDGQSGRTKPLGVTWEESAYIAAANPTVVLALLDVVEVARLPRNTYIYDNPEFMGEWVAVPSADFEALRAALARYEEVKP